jgi:phenylalanyl-tRNA synthetase beta chain
VVADDVSAADTRFENPDWYWLKPTFENATGLELHIENLVPEKVPRFMAVAMSGVQIQPSPFWLQCALVALGSKPINNVVDLTNYMMLLTAQPTHAYDYDKLRGGSLGARMGKAGEKLTLLNGKTYDVTEDDIVIVDDEGPVGMGGVMGGGNSEVSVTTKNIVLECATFDMYTVRKTSMRHGIFTDAVTRFNKGQSPLQNDRVLARLMTLTAESSGARQASPVFDVPDKTGQLDEVSLSGEIRVSAEFINSRLGLNLKALQIGNLLRGANFASYPAEDDETTLLITAPFWRTDIELPEDIVEEVGRLYGFDKLPRELPQRSMKPAPLNVRLEMKRKIRHILSGAGANEVLTYSFVHEKVLKGAGQDPAQAFRLGNALSPDLQYYRLSLIPSLLDKVHVNIKAGHDEFALFEFGKAHRKGDLGEDGLPREYERLAFVYAAKKYPYAAFYAARQYVEMLSDSLVYVPLSEFDSAAHAIFEQLSKPFEPKRAAVVFDGEQFVGVVGEFSAATRRAFKLPEGAAGFELFQSFLLKLAPKQYVPLPRFPSVTQDISLRVSIATPYADVQASAESALGQLRTEVQLLELTPLGIYQPDAGQTKTVTLRLRATNTLRTLTDTEVASYIDGIAETAAKEVGAEKV